MSFLLAGMIIVAIVAMFAFATVGDENPTLSDMAKRLNDKHKVDTIVELLKQTNEILDDMTVIEGNQPTGHRTTVRTGLPSVAWRLLNYGVPSSKSRTAQVTDTAGMLEAYAEVDKELADLNGNTAAFRLSEDRAFMEAMNQEMAETLFYGDVKTNPEKFLGLAARYNDLSAENAENIIDAGGTGSDNTSIWLVVWSPNTVHGFFPKGSTAGFKHRDLGEKTLEDADGGKFQGYRSHYQWKLGLTLRDWRFVVRIANVDVTTLKSDAASGADLITDMTIALERVKALNMGRAAFYCNRRIKEYLRLQTVNKNNVRLSLDEVAGRKVLSFDGVPVRRVDQLLETEARIT